jgi:hypothetical protein
LGENLVGDWQGDPVVEGLPNCAGGESVLQQELAVFLVFSQKRYGDLSSRASDPPTSDRPYPPPMSSIASDSYMYTNRNAMPQPPQRSYSESASGALMSNSWLPEIDQLLKQQPACPTLSYRLCQRPAVCEPTLMTNETI